MSTMPSKQKNTRRQWGNRFDTLLSTEIDKSTPASPEKAVDAVALDQSQPIAQQHEATRANQDTRAKQQENKLPHDASVFVGSLPPQIEETELTRLLLEHLSEHAEVRNVKVIRDAKGGVCAFVQCETAANAAQLINTLNSGPPKLFLGRQLRYEPARAFRSLWVSYRAPKQTVLVTVGQDQSSTAQTEVTHIDLDPPTAMKIIKRSGFKHPTILYNMDAQHAEGNATMRPQDRHPILNSLYLSPVLFDEKTLEAILVMFGPIEYMEPVSGRNQTTQNNFTYLKAHRDPRSPSMDPSVWTVKFGHRDDCISALTTLRQVPHLTVTWAEQPTEQRQWINNSSNNGIRPTIPALSISESVPRPASTITAASPIIEAVTAPAVIAPAGPDATSKESLHNSELVATTNSVTETKEIAPVTYVSNSSKKPELVAQRAVIKTSLADTDFPPLANAGLAKAQPHTSVWNERILPKEEVECGTKTASVPPTIVAFEHEHFAPSEIHEQPARSSIQQADIDSSVSSEQDGLSTTNSEIIIRAPLTIGIMPSIPISQSSPLPTLAVDSSVEDDNDGSQELDMPPTPEFGQSPFTPLTPPFMRTPANASHELPDPSFKSLENRNPRATESLEHDREHSTQDPQAIFVGGLPFEGPSAWTEESVFEHFNNKYGGVIDVKFILPHTGKIAFAFVHFDNRDAPIRAVQEELHATYHGRRIRVQMRNHDPTRGAWKPNRAFKYVPGESPKAGKIRDSVAAVDDNAIIPNAQPAMVQSISIKSDDPFIEKPSALIQFASVNDSPAWMSAENTAYEDENYKLSPPRVHVSTFPSREQSPAPSVRSAPSSHFGATDAVEWAQAKQKGRSDGAYSSQASSTLVSAPYPPSAVGANYMPYQVPGASVFPPHAWVQPMPQHYPYMPYMGYTGYPNFPAPVRPSSPSNSESSSPSTVPQWGGPGIMFPAYLPYPAYTQYNTSNGQGSSHGSLQPASPLVQTGFMQGDAGSLIPMYHPDAYMASASAAHPQHFQTPSTPSTRKPQLVAQTSTWQPNPQLSMYPYPAYGAHAPGMNPLVGQGHANRQSSNNRPQGSHAVMYPASIPLQSHGQGIPHVAFQSPGASRTGYHEVSKRHGGRRDYHSTNRNLNSLKQPRHSEQHSHPSMLPQLPQQFGNGTWNQWAPNNA